LLRCQRSLCLLICCSYVATIGFAAEHASTIEQLLSNQLPVILGPIVMGMHFLYVFLSFFGFVYARRPLWIWLSWRLWKTYMAHSGYE
jgi:hypothetical protein